MLMIAVAVAIEVVPLVSRWLHVGSIIVLAGSLVALRLMLLPAIEARLDSDSGAQLLEAVYGRWRRIVHVCIALISVSGLYNIYYGIVVAGKPVAYHMLLAPKLLAALAIFFILSALVGRGAAFSSMRAHARRWLSIAVLLVVVIVLISGVMRFLPPSPAA